MSHNLWKFLLEDDVDAFRQYLASATYLSGASRHASATTLSPALKIGSPGSLGTSPKTPKQKRGLPSAGTPFSARTSGPILSRAGINSRDALGRTLLHHAASLKSGNALAFVQALIEIPLLDLYVQDAENGWTALHRALYFGNIDVAHALMRKDVQNVTDFASGASLAHLGGLVKIKDFEGNSPFEVFGSTIAPRLLGDPASADMIDGPDDESVNSIDLRDDGVQRDRIAHAVFPRINVRGDEVFAFGSNKNLTLGLGDEDDRQFPERIHLVRPKPLLQRLHEDYVTSKQMSAFAEDASSSSLLPSPSSIPAVVQNQAIRIQDAVMSKLHTAILTTDPMSNLYICGFGPGGRLGTGDETTRFNYVPIQGGGIAKRKVVSIALGHHHTLAICSSGEVFTWGSNKYGQLGYTLPEMSSKDTPMQLVPRQLYGLVKKEQIIGAAASSIHSIIYSVNAMFAFGKNEGQLGLVDADARSLGVQVTPRRVGTSILQSAITSVSTIDRATSVLLENHDVIVFTQYAWKRVIFQLEESPNALFTQAFSTNYNRQINSICKITSGGNTICAISTYGQVFTVDVPREVEHVAPNVSTTNPNKARNALPNPTRVWSIGKPHMAVIDAAVGQDGSIILCTNSGSVWRKEKRAKIKSIHQHSSERGNMKDYKFVRVANLTRAVAVRSNAFGAFIAIRSDADVTHEQLQESPATLWKDLFSLLAFRDYPHTAGETGQNAVETQPRFWVPRSKVSHSASIRAAILANEGAEEDFVHMMRKFEPLLESPYDVWVTSNVTEVQLPVHSFLLKARSRVLRSALAEIQQTYFFSVPDILAVEYGPDGCVRLNFQGVDFLTLVNFVLYLYSDNIVDVWHQTSKALHLAPRYRQVRVELMKIAAALEFRQLERAARVMVDPVPSMRQDFELAYHHLDFWANADVIIDLAKGADIPAHSALLSIRCPFFQGLFHGRTEGMWMSSRTGSPGGGQVPVRVDLKHIEENIFLMVLRHIYADTDEDLFDDVVTDDLDDFIDLIIEVMSVANELMLDRLAQICQKVLGRYVCTRNVCGLLNTVAECSVSDFKLAALEYICLNLESMLDSHLLDELDDYLLEELNTVVQANQLSFMPFVRSGRVEAELLEQHPDLLDAIVRDQHRRIDYMRLPNRYLQTEDRVTPKRRNMQSEDDLPFTMDEDGAAMSPRLRADKSSPSIRPDTGSRRASHMTLSTSYDIDETSSPTGVATEQSSIPDVVPQLSIGSPSSIGNSSSSRSTGVWKSPKLPELKTDFRSIMEQTTGSQVSSLTQRLAAAAPGSPKTSSKLSQKERKRQQQEARKQEIVTKEVGTEQSVPQSPWTKVTPIPRRSVTSPLSDIKPASFVKESAGSPRPGMTMRQTVSGTTNPIKPGDSKSAEKNAFPILSQTSSPPPPQIQSIRHTPKAIRTESSVDARTSMTDILAQQQGEKTAIQEAVAKRSLQEIQQEQEFQAWWDQESRRVQEEEARAISIASRQSKTTRGGSRGGRQGSSVRSASHAGTGAKDRPARTERQTEGCPSGSRRGAVASVDEAGNTSHASTACRRGLGKRRSRAKAHNEEVAETIAPLESL